VVRGKLSEVQIVRAMAIIGVLSVHATSFATIAMKTSDYYLAYNFFNIFMRIGTPVFLFLSSFVLFYSYYSRPLDKALIGNFYKKRLKNILVPYVFFSIFYFLLMHYNYYPDRSLEDSIRKFFVQLFTGKAYTHLYFIFINIQFYVLFPSLLWLFKRRPEWAKWSVLAGFALQWAFVVLNVYYIEYDRPASVSLYYMSYFMLGATLGIYYPKLKAWFVATKENRTPTRLAASIALWTVWLAAALVHVYVYHTARLYGEQYSPLLYHLLWNVHTFAAALAAIQLANFILRRSRLLSGFLTRLGELSFGIYLIHPLFLFLYRKYPVDTGYMPLVHLWYFGGFVFALAASWIVVSLAVRWLPMAWIGFGKVPAASRSSRSNASSIQG